MLLANSIKITGIIDCVDRLTDGALGVVDYKSGKNMSLTFKNSTMALWSAIGDLSRSPRQTYKADADQLLRHVSPHAGPTT